MNMKNLTIKTTDLRQLFKDSAAEWQRREKEILAVADDVESALSQRISISDRDQLIRMRDDLGNAVQELIKQAASPELIIATTGTTSSGKSTLANFLIGEDLLPSAVEEMSAGVVTVCHHDKRHTLTIASTRGATWDTGSWDDLNANNLCTRLEETMIKFREAEKEDSTIEPVHFIIDWPIRIAKELDRLGLPEKTRVTIMDLPGLKAIDDTRNGDIVSKNISKALCLVAYNAEETDDKKQEVLLDQVVAQVLAMRKSNKSLGRMLFLLNRVDAFSRNKNPEESIKKCIFNVSAQIRKRLIERLPEDSKTINVIEPAIISSLPALLAVEADQLELSSEAQVIRFDKIESFKLMFPIDYWKRFPRNLEELTDDERRHLIEDTLRYAHASTFEKRLSDHIAANLAEIVLTGPLSAAEKAAEDLLVSIDQTIEGYSSRTKEEADLERLRLEMVGDKLHKLRESPKALFSMLFNRSGEDVRLITEEQSAKLKKYLICSDELSHDLDSLIEVFHRSFNFVIDEPFAMVMDYCTSVMKEGSADVPLFMVGAPTLSNLDQTILDLKGSPYGNVWENGGKFQYKEGAESVSNFLDKFLEQLSIVATYVVGQAVSSHGRRVESAFRDVSLLFIAAMERDILELSIDDVLQRFPGLKVVLRNEVIFPPYKEKKIIFNVNLSTWKDTKEVVENGIEFERSWKWLWLRKVPVVRPYKKNVDIGGIEVNRFEDFISACFTSEAINFAEDGFKDYLAFLNELLFNSIEKQIGNMINGYLSAISQSVCDSDQRKILEIETLISKKKKVFDLLSRSRYYVV